MKTKYANTTAHQVKSRNGARHANIGRNQTEEFLRENQAILATAEEVAGIGSWKWDLHTRKVSGSDQMFRLFGVEREDFDGDVNRVIAQRIHPEDVAAVQESNHHILEGAEPRPLSYRILLPDGTERTVWAEGRLVYDEVGRPSAVVGYAQDITERVQAEKKILKLKRMYATLSQVNQMIVRVQERDELFQAICDVAVRFGEFDLAWVALLDERSGDVQPVASHGWDIHHWPFPKINIHEEKYSQTLTVMAIRSASVTISDNIIEDGRLQRFNNQIQPYTYHASAVVPLQLRGRIIGVLALASRERGIFQDEEEVSLLEEMGMDISFALENMEKERERRQAEKKVRQLKRLYAILSHVNETIVHVSDRNELYRAICDVAVRFGEFSLAWVGLLDEGTGDILPAAAAGANIDKWPFPIVNVRGGLHRNGVIAEALRTSQVRVSEDIQTDERTITLHSVLRKFGFHTLASVPFQVRGRTIGVVNLISTEMDFFSAEEEQRLLGEMAVNISFALDAMESEQERRQAEQTVHESESRFATFFRSSPTGINIFRLSDGRSININDAFLEIVGYSREEVLSHTARELDLFVDAEGRDTWMKKLQSGEPIRNQDVRIRHKSGEIREALASLDLIEVDGEKMVLVIASDITERKRVEAALRQSEERFSTVFHRSPLGMNITSLQDGIILDVNDAWLDLLGWTRQEVVGKTTADFPFYADPARRPAVRDRIRNEEVTGDLELHLVRKDGMELVADVATTLIDLQGERCILGILIDVTERQQAEEKLRQSEVRYRLISENTADVIWVLDPLEGRFKYISPSVEKLRGYTAAEIMERPVSEALTPESFALVSRLLAERLPDFLAKGSGTESFITEVDQPRRDGSIVNTEVTTTIMFNQQGQVEIVGVSRDITERKRAEQALRENEERLRLSLQAANQGLYDLNVQTGETIVNREYAEMLGYEFETFVETNACWVERLHPDDREHTAQVYQDYIQGLRPEYKIEFRQKTRQGNWKWILSLGKVIEWDEQGNPLRMLGTHTDITERRQAEEKLRASEERYRNLVENMNDIVMEVDAAGNYSYVSPNYIKLSGYSPEEEMGGSALKHIHPDDIQTVMQRLEQAFHSEKQSAVYRVQKKNGEWRWLETVGRPHLAPDGSLHLITVARDISERKQAEDALKRNEQVLRLFVEHSPASIAMFDRDMHYIVASRRYLSDYRLGLQDLTGRFHYDVFPEMPERWKEIHRRCLQGAVERCEADPFPREDGHVDWVRWEIHPWYEETGKIGGIILFSEVITERKLAEKVIRDTNEKLAHAQAMAHIGNWEHDLTNDSLHWSEEMYRIMGFTPGTSISVDQVIQVFPTEEMVRFRKAVNATLYEGAPYSMDYCIVRPDGTVRDIHDEGQAVWDERGNPVRIYGTTQDITVRKQAERQLQALNIDLEQRVMERTVELSRANRAKDEFLANMSHELRTPLNTVLGLSESLLEQRRGTLNEKQIQSIKLIAASGQHLLELINDILEISKIEAGKLELRPAVVSVREVCESSLNFIRQIALRKSIPVEFKYDESLTSLYADPQRLKQILINLLTNAVKFTPNGGRVSLEVATNAERDQILFSISDTGIGITAEDLRKLFTPFTQLDSSLARQYAGTGLGLALVQKLTDLHGGSVQVESEVSQGSRFSVVLPLYEGQCEQNLFRSAVEAVSARQESASETSPVERGTVLLAEDNQINAEMVVEYLETYGYRVVVARDGEEALQKVNQMSPDIILMDIQMPKLDGLEATRLLRREPHSASIPIVALTALAMPGDKERCLEAGVNEYLSKPVSMRLMLKVIAGLTSHSV